MYRILKNLLTADDGGAQRETAAWRAYATREIGIPKKTSKTSPRLTSSDP